MSADTPPTRALALADRITPEGPHVVPTDPVLREEAVERTAAMLLDWRESEIAYAALTVEREA